MFGVSFIKYELKKQEDGSFGLSKLASFDFPYFTFDHDNYSEFMIQLMNSLEYREFYKNQIIVHELEECDEMLFIEHGRYKIGYEINKKSFFRKQLGPQTIIGGY